MLVKNRCLVFRAKFKDTYEQLKSNKVCVYGIRTMGWIVFLLTRLDWLLFPKIYDNYQALFKSDFLSFVLGASISVLTLIFWIKATTFNALRNGKISRYGYITVAALIVITVLKYILKYYC